MKWLHSKHSWTAREVSPEDLGFVDAAEDPLEALGLAVALLGTSQA